ncbi:hypothetical protein AG1IA_10368 [Rhizoctonia solani AG-1 IA]|uniref:Uncharacterized protein n=1 Tax=Thanatephorus cucumeris (strain AG1-IA) TaxID=983506 RepID=L8WFV5_THACA|nr:hypothetical protein AG1IA_10368 [Rhizoctonia solani AG-1 IA]
MNSRPLDRSDRHVAGPLPKLRWLVPGVSPPEHSINMAGFRDSKHTSKGRRYWTGNPGGCNLNGPVSSTTYSARK